MMKKEDERKVVSAEDLVRHQVELTFTVTPNDVDDMGLIYYGGYSRIFDKTRYALCQAYGYIDLADLTSEGWMIPVTQFSIKINRGARVGDVLKARGWWHGMHGVRLRFAAEIYDARTGVLMSYGYTEHCFVDPKTLKPVRPNPNWRLCFNLRHDADRPICQVASEMLCTESGTLAPGASRRVPMPVGDDDSKKKEQAQ